VLTTGSATTASGVSTLSRTADGAVRMEEDPFV
jgi:hypothetical protein